MPAILTRPAAACRAAMIPLHPADDGGRRQFLFEHLAGLLPGLGVAVLRYDRRAAAAGRNVPYLLQAEDLSHAGDVLTTEIGRVPPGLWGLSQGAWVALLAARLSDPSS